MNLAKITCMVEQVMTSFTVEMARIISLVTHQMKLVTMKFSEEQDKTNYTVDLETIPSMEETIVI